MTLLILALGIGLGVQSSISPQDFRGRAAGTEITFVNSATGDTGLTKNATSVTLPAPAGALPGDVLVALLQADYGHIGGQIPAGWVLINQRNESDDLASHTYYKVVGTSEPANYTWTIINTDPTVKAQKNEALAGGTILAFRGVDTQQPVFASVINPETKIPTTIDCPSVNAPAGGMLVCEFTDDDPPPNIAVPASMTRVSNFVIRDNDAHAAAYEKILTAGQAGVRTASFTVPASEAGGGNNDIGIGIVLRPASGVETQPTRVVPSGSVSVPMSITPTTYCLGCNPTVQPSPTLASTTGVPAGKNLNFLQLLLQLLQQLLQLFL